MIDVVTEIVIDRPVEVVARVAVDPDRVTQWYANIESVEWQTPPPLGRGTRLTFVARFLGRRLEYTYEIVDFEPGARFVMRTAQGPFPMETTYTWDTEGPTRTRMQLGNRGEPSGFSSVMGPFMAMAMRRANNKDLRRLKSLLESGGTTD